MLLRLVRLLVMAAAGALVGWCARLFAHAKSPPPEGRWREVTAEELGE